MRLFKLVSLNFLNFFLLSCLRLLLKGYLIVSCLLLVAHSKDMPPYYSLCHISLGPFNTRAWKPMIKIENL